MTEAVVLIVRYQTYIYAAIGLLAVVYLVALLRARGYLSRTPFGLEREWALQRQNGALAMLTVLVALAVAVYLMGSVLLPGLMAPRVTPTPAAGPTATASPVASNGEVVVDSSGCENPNATLTAPQPGERIAGSFEVRGTANIENFAFYKFEISGAGTGGEWLSLGVGTEPKVNDRLGSFDATARNSGSYAFRLVVLDSLGAFPPPCVVAITLVNASGP